MTAKCLAGYTRVELCKRDLPEDSERNWTRHNPEEFSDNEHYHGNRI